MESFKNLDMGRVANVIGGTGFIGQNLVNQLLFHSEFEKVRIFVRRKTRFIHTNLEEIIIDFDQPESWKHLVQGDVLFSILGTTLKTVRTRKSKYRVGYTNQYEFARAAAENGVSTYILVSSVGANSKSLFFYSRMKGKLEEEVARLNFRKLFILRPSILDGPRSERRLGEKFRLFNSRLLYSLNLKKFRPTPVNVLTSKMIRLSVGHTEGFRLVEGDEIFSV